MTAVLMSCDVIMNRSVITIESFVVLQHETQWVGLKISLSVVHVRVSSAQGCPRTAFSARVVLIRYFGSIQTHSNTKTCYKETSDNLSYHIYSKMLLRKLPFTPPPPPPLSAGFLGAPLITPIHFGTSVSPHHVQKNVIWKMKTWHSKHTNTIVVSSPVWLIPIVVHLLWRTIEK